MEFAGLERERISNCSAKHDLSGAEASDGAGVVPVHEESFHDFVGVEGPGLRDVSPDQPLGGSSGMTGGMAGLLGANLEHCLQPALWLMRSCLK